MGFDEFTRNKFRVWRPGKRIGDGISEWLPARSLDGKASVDRQAHPGEGVHPLVQLKNHRGRSHTPRCQLAPPELVLARPSLQLSQV